jgi:hypothetical protein
MLESSKQEHKILIFAYFRPKMKSIKEDYLVHQMLESTRQEHYTYLLRAEDNIIQRRQSSPSDAGKL